MSNSNPRAVESISPVFAALGDATRLQLIQRLAQAKPRSIAQLAHGLEISHQGVTKHLKVLESAGLVEARKVGRERQYECAPAQLRSAQQYLDGIANQWDSALERLRNMVED